MVVTGGIGSGKTTFCRILKHLGAYQIDSDEIVHHLLTTHQPTIDQIVDLLGKNILVNEKIDRKKIADIVFFDDRSLKALEKILHPKLLEIIRTQYEKLANGLYKFFVVEMPLIQEIEKEKEFDFVVAIISNETDAIKRTPLSEKEYHRRMKNHWSIQKKAQFADYVVTNNNSINELKNQAVKLIKTLKL